MYQTEIRRQSCVYTADKNPALYACVHVFSAAFVQYLMFFYVWHVQLDDEPKGKTYLIAKELLTTERTWVFN